MIIYVDVQTLALTTEGSVPLTDMALVRGDKIPLRIVLTDGPGLPADSQEVPVVAIKKSLGNDTLVLAATGLKRVADAMGTAYVGHLSVNTTQLADAMGSQDRIDLVGEVVLAAPDGSQRTSRLIRVTVRRDILPADYAPPAEVLADWTELVASALAAQLPDALTAAGMHVAPVTGSSTLTTGPAETPTVVACYAMTWGDELLAGHLTDHCRLRQVTVTYYTDTGLTVAHWLRIWRLDGTQYVVAGVAPAVELPANNQPFVWDFTSGVPLHRGDQIMLEICTGPDADHLITRGLGLHAVITPAKPGRGLAPAVVYPPSLDQSMAPMMSVTVDYDDGVMVGGVELATAAQMQALGSDVRTSSADAQSSAQQASGDASQVALDKRSVEDARAALLADIEAAQAILAAIPQADAAGNMTLAGKLTARSANLNGPMIVNNPTGNLVNGTHNQIHGVTWFYQQSEFRDGAIIRGNTFLESGVLSISAAASLNCKGPATYGATINANSGINIPEAAVNYLLPSAVLPSRAQQIASAMYADRPLNFDLCSTVGSPPGLCGSTICCTATTGSGACQAARTVISNEWRSMAIHLQSLSGNHCRWEYMTGYGSATSSYEIGRSLQAAGGTVRPGVLSGYDDGTLMLAGKVTTPGNAAACDQITLIKTTDTRANWYLVLRHNDTSASGSRLGLFARSGAGQLYQVAETAIRSGGTMSEHCLAMASPSLSGCAAIRYDIFSEDVLGLVTAMWNNGLGMFDQAIVPLSAEDGGSVTVTCQQTQYKTLLSASCTTAGVTAAVDGASINVAVDAGVLTAGIDVAVLVLVADNTTGEQLTYIILIRPN